MFALTPETAFALFTEWLTRNEPQLAEQGMTVEVPSSLFTELWPEWPTS